MRLGVSALAIVLAAAGAAGSPIAVEIELHPALDAAGCPQLPRRDQIRQESDFVAAVERGWVTLVSHAFDAELEFWPCIQRVRVEFPSPELFREFAASMSACPQYPFYSGADYHLQTRIFERAAAGGDVETLRILLAKDARSCASELNPPLYAILRRNPRTFLAAFAQLEPARQQAAAEAQYDFNLPLWEQQFSRAAIAALPGPLRAPARKFNELLAASANPPAPPETHVPPDAP